MGNCILKSKKNEIIEDSTMDDTVCGINSSINSNYSSSHNYTTNNNRHFNNKE